MTPQSFPRELSLIVPLLNEAANLPALFAMLARQQQVAFEVVLTDGGSTDGTVEQAEALSAQASFPCRLLRCGKGRARQLNAGAREARADWLLFLHADCAFPDPLALRRGLDALREASARRGDGRVAGRFALRFAVLPGRYGFGYYFYEAKARLGRPEGIHGDQGFLFPRAFFESLGGFDEALSLLEDNRFAEAVRRQGEWRLLPAEIVTSARRFEAEGLAERQTLNALVMNFAAIGWAEFFRAAPALYRSQEEAGRLRLAPFFRCIRDLLRPLPRRRQLALWLATGRYVRANAWQLPFARDAERAFRRGLPPGTGPTPALDRHERWFDRLTDHAFGHLATAVLVWGWFHLTLGGCSPGPRTIDPPKEGAAMQPATLETGNAIPLLRTLGIRLTEIGERHAVMEVDVEQCHGNYFGGAHGGLIATLIDTVCFFPRPFLPSGRLVTTVNLNVNYVRAAAPGDHLVARSEVLHLGRRTASLAVRVTKEEGELVAHGTVTLLVLREPEKGQG